METAGGTGGIPPASRPWPNLADPQARRRSLAAVAPGGAPTAKASLEVWGPTRGPRAACADRALAAGSGQWAPARQAPLDL